MYATQSPTEPLAIDRPWPAPGRLAFRLACAYYAVFIPTYITGYIEDVPGGRPLLAPYYRVVHTIVPWIGKHVLRLSPDITAFTAGSGDTRFDWVLASCIVTMAIVAAAIWSVIDRRRTEYRTLHQWLRVALRYTLALALLSYGMVKVIKLQFSFPSLEILLEPYGQSSPMRLLWTFMGYSTAYTFFSGAIETVAGVLMFSQRTTPLGALLACGGMANVVMMNLSYDVPVKLYSMNLLLMAVVLLLPDARRLANVLVLNRPAEASSLRTPPRSPRARRCAVVAKTLAVGVILSMTVVPPVLAWQRGDRAPKPALLGIYEVESFSRDGQPVAPLLTDRTRWRRVTIDRFGRLAIHMADDSIEYFRCTDDGTSRRLELASVPKGDAKHQLEYASAGDRLTLHGRFKGSRLDVELRRVPMESLLLVGRGFHWVNEFPFNR